MKLLILTRFFKKGYGVGLVIKKQIEGLSVNNEVYIATDDEITSENASKINLDYSMVRETINRVKPDAVIVHTPPYYEHVAQFNDYPVIKIAFDHGEPFPGFFRDDIKEREKINMQKYLAFMEFHIHISISEFIKKSSNIKSSIVIYNGADHIHREENTAEMDIRKNLGIDEKSFLITTLSRIGSGENYYKGFDFLIEIKRRTLELITEKDIYFLVIGHVTPDGEPVKEKLLSSNFRVLENVSEDVKYDILSQSNIFISPSLWEGFNLPVVEAQYLGVPSLAFSVAAHPEVCPFHFSNINEMTEYIISLYKDRELLKWCGRTCSDYVKKKFTWKNNILKLEKLLNNVWEKKEDIVKIKHLDNEGISDNYHNKKIIDDHIKRTGLNAEVQKGLLPETYRVKFNLKKHHLISIIIPNKDHIEDLRTCINSIKKSDYKNFEIIIVENGSSEENIFNYYEELKKTEYIKIIEWNKGIFNYSAINNFAVPYARGDVILFLNNDTEVINTGWLTSMVEHAVRKEVGAVGAKLYFPDNSVQHGSVIIGINGVAGHAHRNFPHDSPGYFGRLKIIQNVSAVTAACLMIRKEVFNEVNGFDEDYAVSFNDIDFCMKIRKKGYLIVWTPYAELYHHELKTRGTEDTCEKKEREKREIELFRRKWKDILEEGDPYYNPNLRLDKEDFSLKSN